MGTDAQPKLDELLWGPLLGLLGDDAVGRFVLVVDVDILSGEWAKLQAEVLGGERWGHVLQGGRRRTNTRK